jgi:rhamnose transport system substrate-binding protein
MAGILNGAEAGPGSTVKMGRMGQAKVAEDGEASMGEPFTFDKSNIEKFAKIF